MKEVREVKKDIFDEDLTCKLNEKGIAFHKILLQELKLFIPLYCHVDDFKLINDLELLEFILNLSSKITIESVIKEYLSDFSVFLWWIL